MSDKEPLLNASGKLSSGVDNDDNENKKKSLSKSLDDWRRCFTRTKSEGKYIELNENNEHDEKDEPVDILRLFQFANTFDWIMMCTAMFFIIIHAGCILANLFLYGQLTGLFAIDSYASNCNNSNQNATASIHRKNAVLQGIELQAFGNAQSHKLRNDSGIIASSGLSRSQFVFRDNVMALVYWLFIIGAVEFLVSSIESFLWNWTIKRQTYRMSVSLFKSLAQRRIPYLDSNQATQLNAKLFDNIAKIEKGIGIELLILIATITGIFGCLIMSFAVNWKLTMIMLFLIPLVIGSSLVFSKLTANETVYELKTYAKTGQIVQEFFSSLRTVLSTVPNLSRNELALTRSGGIRQGALFGVFIGWLSLITFIVCATDFISGSFLMTKKNQSTFTISDILIVASIFSQSIGLISFVGSFVQGLSEARGAAVSVFRLIDEEKDESINEAEVWEDITESRSNINGDIKFNNVNFHYPSRRDAPVLCNLSVVARAGQTTALVGFSGCGKSTCISLFLRYYEPSSGEITIDGKPITNYNVQHLRENIGVVSQEPVLFGMTIYENIRFGKLNATQDEIEEAAREANAHNFIMQLPDVCI
ncbi:unnamed protein product [Rotaria socialis]|uniref:ABC transmembrane type-1 domain-containing protein n=1 Tax=Rotaria socialis TaxID=392032 RepID=A0A821TL91_9BILA|nr:unnamed protein product [Rotaria socialis]